MTKLRDFMGRPLEGVVRRALEKVVVDKATGCWIWTGSRSRGYGQLSSRKGLAPFKAHVLMYEIFRGHVPDGMVVRHDCDRPECCNPQHLRTGTQKDNMQDALRRGRYSPVSLFNLRPGARGFHGAGPKSIGEL